MDFSNRAQAPAPASTPATAGNAGRKNKSNSGMFGGLSTVFAVVVVAVVLLAAVILSMGGLGGGNSSEYKSVDKTKLQAVFLNTGQVYFGNVKSLNNKFVELTNIYYLQTSQASSTTSSSVSLVKLGCELHQPDDKMLINRDQVTFWENLHASGQVAKAVSTFEKQNPNGQKCADQSSSAPTTSGASSQPAGSSTPAGTTTPATAGTTTRP